MPWPKTHPLSIPGCCGNAECKGCAWECTHDDHDYYPSATIRGQQTWVCGWCGNVTPVLDHRNVERRSVR